MNKQNIINQVLKAIKTYPTSISLKRTPKIDDGMNGYIEDTENEINVATFDGFIDESGSSLSITLGDGGRVQRVRKISLIVPYSENFKIEIGDHFETKEKKYRVVYPNNLFDVCYICELEVYV